MARLITYGRRGLHALFKGSGLFNGMDQPHHPFLVFLVEEDGTVRVTRCKSSAALLTHGDGTRVMAQWPGKTRSDWFTFTVGEYRQFVAHGGIRDEGDLEPLWFPHAAPGAVERAAAGDTIGALRDEVDWLKNELVIQKLATAEAARAAASVVAKVTAEADRRVAEAEARAEREIAEAQPFWSGGRGRRRARAGE